VNATCINSPSLSLRLRSRRSSAKHVLPSTISGLLVLAAVILLPSAVLADSVTLKNGDHLTGTVTQLAGGKLTVKTSYAGDLTITWDEVTSVHLDKPLVMPVETKHGKQVEINKVDITGIERTPSGFVVTTASGMRPVPPSDLTALRTAAAQQAYEASLRPNFLHGWIGAANLSLAVTGGNSETTSIGTGVNLSRPTQTDKTALYFNTVYTHDNVQGITIADTTTAGLRYDHNLNPKLFGFGTLDFDRDALQDLDLRTVVGGGFGWHAIAKPNRQLDILGGAVWTHEDYNSNPLIASPAIHNSFAALDFGQQFTEKFGKSTVLTEQAYFFPDVQDISQYRATVNAGLSTRINGFLSWQTSYSDIYVTNPPPETKSNDVILTTGIGFTFTKK
jgi:putative salt-induced outer membrane protein YdiY